MLVRITIPDLFTEFQFMPQADAIPDGGYDHSHEHYQVSDIPRAHVLHPEILS